MKGVCSGQGGEEDQVLPAREALYHIWARWSQLSSHQKSSFSSYIITHVKINLGLVFGSTQEESLPVTSQSVQAVSLLGVSFTSLWYEALQVQDGIFTSGVKTEC